MSNNQPERTPEQMKEYIALLEAKLSGKKEPKAMELRVTIDGEVQIRHITPQAINLPADVVTALFTNAPTITKFINENKTLLVFANDTDEAVQTKAELRRQDLETNPKSVVRKPRADSKTA